MERRVIRPGVRRGYDLWSESYDSTPNPLVAVDRRHTLRALSPAAGERILDAGCGTGAHLAAIHAAGAIGVGLDFSLGMLRLAQQRLPGTLLLQADLCRSFPTRPGAFDAVLCALVSEHLAEPARFFAAAHAALRSGGRLVFSAFHPDLALAGVEANFLKDGVEYRLGAETHGVEDFVAAMVAVGFDAPSLEEHGLDDSMAERLPKAQKYLGRPLLLLLRSIRS